jgi:hypothetical protein
MTDVELLQIEVDPRVRAVVVGQDYAMSVPKLNYAMQCLTNPDVHFIGTNRAVFTFQIICIGLQDTFPQILRILPSLPRVAAFLVCISDGETVFLFTEADISSYVNSWWWQRHPLGGGRHYT